MSECDATVGQVAKGTTASFALGPHGASVCGRTEHALPGVEVVGGVWALVGAVFGDVALDLVPAGGVFGGRIVPFAPVGGVFGLVALDSVPVGGVFGGRIVPFAPAVGVFSCVGEGADGVCGVFDGVAVDFVPAGGVFGSAAAACGVPEGETGAKRSASDGAGGADVDEATEEGAAERRLD